MMKRKSILSLYLAIPVFLGCLVVVVGYMIIRDKQKNEERLLAEGVPLDYAYRWLDGIPCSPPCWEGVTPGVTTVSEAIEILNQSPGIAKGSVVLIERHNSGTIYWHWAGTDRGGDVIYDVRDPNKVVTLIAPWFDSLPGLDRTFVLEDVISKLGDPSYVTAYVWHGIEGQGTFFVVKIYFVEEGVSLEKGTINRWNPRISPKMEFSLARFHALPFDPSATSAIWSGYKSFWEYCNDMPSGFSCE